MSLIRFFAAGLLLAGTCLTCTADQAEAASLGASASALLSADRAIAIEGVLPLHQVQYRHGGGYRGGVHGGGGPRVHGGGGRYHGGGGGYHHGHGGGGNAGAAVAAGIVGTMMGIAAEQAARDQARRERRYYRQQRYYYND